jgi:cell division transport system permease protein
MRANFVIQGVFAGIRRNLTMTVALVLSTSIALAFVGAAFLANTEIQRFKVRYEGKINVSVFLCPQVFTSYPNCHHKTTPAETAALQAKLNADPRVRSQSYVSEELQLERGRAIEGPEAGKYLKLGDLPASFTVKLHNVKRDYPQFAIDYAKVTGVGSVNNQYQTIKTLLQVIDGARWFSLVIALVVLIASILLIANTITVAAAQRKPETSIMRLVGASRWMTELPFMLEAVLATILGGVLAGLLTAVGEHYVFDGIFKIPVANGVIPNLSTNDVLIASLVGMGIGAVLAGITAFLTLRLYVRL